jgi:hypothetical protein
VRHPQRPPGFKRLLKLAVRPRAVEQDVDEELRFHLEMRAATRAWAWCWAWVARSSCRG